MTVGVSEVPGEIVVTLAADTVGAVKSTITEKLELDPLIFPAWSVDLAAIVYLPSLNVGERVHAPDPFAAVEPGREFSPAVAESPESTFQVFRKAVPSHRTDP